MRSSKGPFHYLLRTHIFSTPTQEIVAIIVTCRVLLFFPFSSFISFYGYPFYSGSGYRGAVKRIDTLPSFVNSLTTTTMNGVATRVPTARK